MATIDVIVAIINPMTENPMGTESRTDIIAMTKNPKKLLRKTIDE